MLDVGWGGPDPLSGRRPAYREYRALHESIGDARSFLSAARGWPDQADHRHQARPHGRAAKVMSPPAMLTGGDEVLAAAFRRNGVLRVDTIADLFSMAEVLSKPPAARATP